VQFVGADGGEAGGWPTAVYDSASLEDGELPPIAPGCPDEHPWDGACSPRPTPTGSHACDDDAIEALLPCFVDFDADACSDAAKAHAACAKCALWPAPDGWIAEGTRTLDTAACVRAIAPSDPCATTVTCPASCALSQCASCKEFDYEDCLSRVLAGASFATLETDAGIEDADAADAAPLGVCWSETTASVSACLSDVRFRACIPDTKEGVRLFLRGACRDGGDWSKAMPSDGAVDADSDPDG
jgi:hypothetical protein